MKKGLVCVLGLVLAAICVWLDQFTKSLAVANLKGQEDFVVIKDVFVLHYLENEGAAFGMLQNRQLLFFIGTVIIVAAVAFLYARLPVSRKYVPLRIVSILIISGAIGNFIDRVTNQYVVDFFYFQLIHFPVFNVADVYVTGGAIAFAVLILFFYKEEDFKLVFHRGRKHEAGE